MQCRVLENCEGGAAVAAMQKKWFTDLNWKFRTAGIFGRGGGAAVANCTVAFLARGGTGRI